MSTGLFVAVRHPHWVTMPFLDISRQARSTLVRPMATRRLVRCLRSAGCVLLRRSGRHDVYACPCGAHIAPVPTSHRMVSAGVVRSIEQAMACLGRGWLQ